MISAEEALARLDVPAPPVPRLFVDGVWYGGWTGLRIMTSLEHCSGAFNLDLTERWGGDFAPPVKAGLPCRVKLGEQIVVTGWIDSASRALSDFQHRVSITGRDATADLVDCAATVTQYTGQDLLAIATDQAEPYNVVVGLAPGANVGAPFARVAVEPGETVFDLLDRLARCRGLLLMPDQSGGLLLGVPSGEPSGCALVEGGNLLAIQVSDDWRDRYSEIIVRGQSAGSDERSGPQAAQIEARATDPDVAVSRTRRHIINAESADVDLQARADWEVRVRLAKSLSVGATVQGWEAAPGRLWRAGQSVRVRSTTMSLDEDLLIRGCTYTLDQGGTRCNLDLVPAAALDPGQPLPDPAPADAGAAP